MPISTSKTIRVAAAQCAIGSSIDDNLQTCLRVLDKAAAHSPDLVVLPEFSNHLSWYDNDRHCYEVSLSLDSPFLQAVAAKAKSLSAYVAIGATLRREGGKVSGSSLLYSPEGELLGIADKQVLIGHENDFLLPAIEAAPIIDTDIGKLAMYMCMDGVINETPRCLALRGAQILCNSLNSFAPDEGNLHIPVRAAENKVFVVAANKVGPLVPEEMMAGISAATNIPEVFLCGAGESQIVAPDGTVLAMAKTAEEEIVVADINPAQADNKCRPDGTDIFASRRPELYVQFSADPALAKKHSHSEQVDVSAALIQVDYNSTDGIAAACSAIGAAQKNGAAIVALAAPSAIGSLSSADLPSWNERGSKFVDAVATILQPNCYASCAIVAETESGFQHQIVLVSADGIIARQGQVHSSERFSWSELDNSFQLIELPFAKLTLMASDDSIYPESFRLAALAGAEVVVVPVMPLERWELHTGLIERAAENRVNLLAPAIDSEFGSGFGAGLLADFTIFGEWKTREFDGVLTRPPITAMDNNNSVKTLLIHPANAANKVVSRNTHLLDNRPWHLLEPMSASI
ncbi:MAG: nitrilase-related carbon-nitrogen hydrolase [Spongiibacteraceae bacterium]